MSIYGLEIDARPELWCDLCGAGPFRTKNGLGVHKNGLRCNPIPRWSNEFKYDDGKIEVFVGLGLRFIMDAPDDTREALFRFVDCLKRDQEAAVSLLKPESERPEK